MISGTTLNIARGVVDAGLLDRGPLLTVVDVVRWSTATHIAFPDGWRREGAALCGSTTLNDAERGSATLLELAGESLCGRCGKVLDAGRTLNFRDRGVLLWLSISSCVSYAMDLNGDSDLGEVGQVASMLDAVARRTRATAHGRLAELAARSIDDARAHLASCVVSIPGWPANAATRNRMARDLDRLGLLDAGTTGVHEVHGELKLPGHRAEVLWADLVARRRVDGADDTYSADLAVDPLEYAWLRSMNFISVTPLHN